MSTWGKVLNDPLELKRAKRTPLGAFAIWRQYQQNPEETSQKYINMMKSGYSKPIPQLYKEAGIDFSFSVEYISDLMKFVKKELEKLS